VYLTPEDAYFNTEDIELSGTTATVAHCLWSNATVIDTKGTAEPGDDIALGTTPGSIRYRASLELGAGGWQVFLITTNGDEKKGVNVCGPHVGP
jgi:hypothetical protein